MEDLAKDEKITLARQAVQRAGLYLVPEARLDALCQTAADAYQDYPLHSWFTNGTYDPAALSLIMKASLASMKDDAVVYADSEALNGFAVWLPAGFTGSKSLPFLRNGGVRLLLHSGLGVIRKLLIFEHFAMELKKKYTGHKDWYLYNLSVRRAAQGKGIATKLLKPMLQFCSDDRMPVYLETNKDANVPMYEHFGFRLQETRLVPGSTVRHYVMLHSPD